MKILPWPLSNCKTALEAERYQRRQLSTHNQILLMENLELKTRLRELESRLTEEGAEL